MNNLSKFHSYVILWILLMIFGMLSDTHAQQKMMKPPEFQVIVSSRYNFEDTAGLLKGAIEEENLMVIMEIDARKMLRMVGVQIRGMKQILFFHPRYMKRILEINKHAAIEPPLKIALMEMPDGKVMVKYIKPTYIFGRYVNLEKLGQELEAIVIEIVKSVRN